MPGHKVMVLIDNGASHNYIDAAMVEWRGIPTKVFDGFVVAIRCGHQMDYTRYVPKPQLTMGNHTVTEEFFVVHVSNTNVVLGV